MKTIEQEKNWIFSYKIWEHTTVENVPSWIPYNPFTSFSRFLIEWWKISTFDNERNILTDLYSDFIFIEYSNEEVRKSDIKNNKKIKIISPIKSEVIDWNKQLAENSWEFEYNWKFYLVLSPINTLTNETNPEKWVFRWVIVDSNKYFAVNNQAKEISEKIKWIL